MNSDFRELLQCFAKHKVRYLVNYLSLADLRLAKAHADRAQDRADLEELNRSQS